MLKTTISSSLCKSMLRYINGPRTCDSSAAKLALVVALAFGVLLGLGTFTFDFAEGLSYLSNDPKACVNCHIMNDEYNGWTKGSHHAVATCNDCHLTHTFPSYYFEKGLNGWNHSRGVHDAGLSRADHDQRAQQPHPSGQLPALS